MKQTRVTMGMPVCLEIIDSAADSTLFDQVFAYFNSVDAAFSPFKIDSQVSLYNRGLISSSDFSPEMQEIMFLSAQTKSQTLGFFNVFHDGVFNPSGLVKGWAIQHAANLLSQAGMENYYLNAGGDIQVSGVNAQHLSWRVGLQNPFDKTQIVKVVALSHGGIATSGTYERGDHIYDPHGGRQIHDLVSFTVIGPNVYEADRMATAAFAMGRQGIEFINRMPEFAGYAIDTGGLATFTANFSGWLCQDS